MRKKARRSLALLLALAMMVTLAKSDELFVSAESSGALEQVSSVTDETQEEIPAEVQTEGKTESETDALSGTDMEAEDDVRMEEDVKSTDDVLTEAESENSVMEEAEAEPENSVLEEADAEAPDDAIAEDGMQSEKETENTLLEYTPVEQPKGITVKAYVKEGVLPEKADIVVSALLKDGETAGKYSEAAKVLAGSGIEYDGFLAFDIGFRDEDGNEIEPEEGTVQVKLAMDTELLPKYADAGTLSVQHLAETEDGVKVETVADVSDAADGTVEVRADGTGVEAEFEVESFSTFTITWTSADTGIMPLAATSTDTTGQYPVLFAGDSIAVTQPNSVSWGTNNQVSYSGNNVSVSHVGNAYVAMKSDWQGKVTPVAVLLPDTVEAKVYLRYSNEIPSPINGAGTAAEFGPSGDNTPYITVTVDLKALVETDGVKPYITYSSYYKYYLIYFSIENNKSYQTGDENRKKDAGSFWDKYIYSNIESGDKSALDAIFGEDRFIGYVLKIESDGWHIDGVLTEDPPVYVVELYDTDAGNKVAFAISSGNESLPGVTLEDFKTKLEEYLDGDTGSYRYETSGDGRGLVVTYTKNGDTYVTTIDPYEKDGYSALYSIDSTNEKFTYRTVTDNIYFLCRLQMKTEKYTSLTVTKKVTGNLGDTNEKFAFHVQMKDANGNTIIILPDANAGYTVDKDGSASFTLAHNESVTFKNLDKNAQLTITEMASGYTATINVYNGEELISTDGKVETDEKTITVDVSSGNKVEFVNDKDMIIDTGIRMDSLPYVLILVAVMIGMAMLIFKKRRRCWKR